MNYESFLTTFGLSQLQLEVLLILFVIVIVIGYVLVMFWQQILAGLGILLAVFVFAHHPAEKIAVVESTESEIVIPVNNVKINSPVEKTEKEMFMEDCVELSSKPQDCEDIWKERQE